jgi:hypothetical protein
LGQRLGAFHRASFGHGYELVRNILLALLPSLANDIKIGRPRLGTSEDRPVGRCMFRDGHPVRQVADLLGVSRSEAGRLRLRAAADGIIGAVGEDESEEAEPAAERPSRLN